ncbi:MAG: hypothetical protein LBE36_06075 [Flavobacteriaceae bacterium]|jgi:hypothetical protein|nr:hypothetical protein [Flavobacteriaceae bacterium]
MTKQKERERKKLLKELDYFTRYYSEIAWRGKQIKEFYDHEIERIINALKELGK